MFICQVDARLCENALIFNYTISRHHNRKNIFNRVQCRVGSDKDLNIKNRLS